MTNDRLRRIILINVGTEHALGDASSTSHPITRSARRHTWFADNDDILVTPVEIDQPFLDYVAETVGFDAGRVSIVGRNEALYDEILVETELHQAIKARMDGSGAWNLFPCFWTPGVSELSASIGLEPTIGSRFASQRGTDLLNRKSHFRQLAISAGLPLAQGAVARSSRDLARAIETHLPQTGTVIVKKDDAGGGMGNVTLTANKAAPLPGSRETLPVRGDLQAIADTLWTELTDQWSRAVVVESYHKAAHRFYVEYEIPSTGIARFLNCGTIRTRPDADPLATELVWVGLDIPAQLPVDSAAEAITHATRFADLASQLGYRGAINIDAIIDDAGSLIFNEANARWGGGLVMHAIATRLVGDRYASSHAVSSVRDITAMPFADLKRLLRDTGLHFTRSSQEGVVVLSCDPSLVTTTECLIIGRSRDRVRQFEAQLRVAVETATAHH